MDHERRVRLELEGHDAALAEIDQHFLNFSGNRMIHDGRRIKNKQRNQTRHVALSDGLQMNRWHGGLQAKLSLASKSLQGRARSHTPAEAAHVLHIGAMVWGEHGHLRHWLVVPGSSERVNQERKCPTLSVKGDMFFQRLERVFPRCVVGCAEQDERYSLDARMVPYRVVLADLVHLAVFLDHQRAVGHEFERRGSQLSAAHQKLMDGA